MLLAGPANLQRVPSPLLYVGRRGGVPFVSELAAARLACASVAYLAGVSSSRAETGAGAVVAGRVRRTQDGALRVCQDGRPRGLPTWLQAAAIATPAETAAQRLACVAASYGDSPTAAGMESAPQRLGATASAHTAAALASLVESVAVRTAATSRAYQAAGIRSASRLARQRLACFAATYAPV